MLSKSNFGHPDTATQGKNLADKLKSFTNSAANFSSKDMEKLQQGGKKIAENTQKHPIAALAVAAGLGFLVSRLFTSKHK